LVAAPWLIATACGGGGGNHAVLTRVVPASACAAGGVTIGSGSDTNDNGVLDDTEVTATHDVCNGTMSMGAPGEAGFDTLVQTTDLPEGDPNCDNGGTKIEVGLDDGAGAGMARDGVLQPGEVSSTKFVCNGGLPTFRRPMTPPTEPTARFRIDTSGGNGTVYSGGYGGDVYAYMDYGTAGGHIKMFATGGVDASFTVPTIAFQPGAVPLVVSSDLTLSGYVDQATGLASADEYFFVNGGTTLYKDVTGVATPVTSIDVQAGKTLTLALSYSAGSEARVTVSDDIRNAGTIRAALRADMKSRGQLWLRCDNYTGLAGSSIAQDGANAPGDTAGDGGYVQIRANGNLINQGTISNSGGNGDYSGEAGGMLLRATDGAIYNTGALTSKGGSSAASYGASGGGIELRGGYRGMFNSGAIVASGGDGSDGGGDGGYLELYVNELGSVTLSGTITSKGGACSAIDCYGGGGGSLDSYTYSGRTIVTGDIDVSGADSRGTSQGGYGGDVYFYNSDENSNYDGYVYVPTGNMEFAANIVTKGGNGGSGGGGGAFTVQMYPYYVPQGQEIIFYGYSSVKTSGGNGMSDSGGGAGDVYLYFNDAPYIFDFSEYAPAGAVINYVPIEARGGNGTYGGDGGAVDFYGQSSYYFGNDFEIVLNRAAVDARGGDASGSYASGGQGGYVYFASPSGVDNNALLNSSGGMTSGVGGNGGSGGEVYFGSDNAMCVNTGAIELAGGTSTAALSSGGSGGSYYQYCLPSTNAAAVNLKGGNGVDYGGDGGWVELLTTGSSSSNNTGMLSLAAGTGGDENGQKGTVMIDGVNVTP
jgi:hypothetical protein